MSQSVSVFFICFKKRMQNVFRFFRRVTNVGRKIRLAISKATTPRYILSPVVKEALILLHTGSVCPSVPHVASLSPLACRFTLCTLHGAPVHCGIPESTQCHLSRCTSPHVGLTDDNDNRGLYEIFPIPPTNCDALLQKKKMRRSPVIPREDGCSATTKQIKALQ